MGGFWLDVTGTAVEVLLRNSAYAVLVSVPIAVVCGTLRGRAPALQLALWSLVFLRLVVPPNLSHPLSAGELLTSLESLLGADRVLSVGEPAGMLAALRPVGAVGLVGEVARSPAGWGVWVFVAWIMGVALAASGHLRRLRRVHRLVADGETCADREPCELLDRWRRRLRIRRRVRLVTADREVVPFTVGVLRPVVFVPRHMLRDQSTSEPALAHELAHVTCWHAFWLAMQHAVQIAYWFHPVVWLAGSRIRHERERLCDALVLGHGAISAPRYARSLLLASRLHAPDGPAFELAFPSRRFSMRIHDILEPSKRRRPRRLLAALCTAGVAFVLLPMAGGPVTASTEDQRHQPPPAGAVALGNPLLEGRISWRWGDGHDPWTGEPVFHRGIDLAAPAGTPIVAPADGTVTVAAVEYQPSPTSGTVAILDHGRGLTTFYAHLGRLAVASGERVAAGQVIAEVGSSGKSTAPHLHFEVRYDGEPQDPARFVGDWE